MFGRNPNFNQDISGWDTSKVTNMSRMFFQTSTFDQDISSWDVSNVSSFSSFSTSTSPNWTSSEKPNFN